VFVLSIPNGHTVMYPADCGDTTVTFNTTAATLAAGIPPWPVTCTVAVPNAATAPVICWLTRESAIRAGVTDTTAPGSDGPAGAAATEAAGGIGTAPADAAGAAVIDTATAATTPNTQQQRKEWSS